MYLHYNGPNAHHGHGETPHGTPHGGTVDQDTHAQKAKTGEHADDIEGGDEEKEDSDDDNEDDENVKESAKQAIVS